MQYTPNIFLYSGGSATFSSSVTANGLYANAGNSARFYRGANDYYWSIHNDSNNFLNFGTYAANGTAYGTNPKVILLDNGNVGIGTTSPLERLDVRGSILINQDAALRAGSSQQWLIGQDSGTNVIHLGSTGVANDIRFDSSTGSGIVIIKTNGNVGIGTISPASLLHIYSASGARLRMQSTASTYSLLDFYNNTTPRWSIGIDNTQSYGKLENRVLGTDVMRFYDSSNNLILNPSSGNVGIGTTSPNKKLELNVANGVSDGLRITYNATISEGLDITYLNSGNTTISFDSIYNSNSAVMQFRMKTNGAPLTAMTILGSGNVGINTTSPAEKLHIVGNIQLGSNSNQYIRYRTQSAWDYYLKADSDDFVIYDSQSTEFFRAIYNGGGTAKYAQFLNSLRAHNNSNVTVLGTLTENSSLRYKENIKTIEYGLDKVLQMRGVSYTKKDTGLKELGLIAEEVNEILPDVVLKNNEGEPDSVSYGRITAVLIEAIKDLQQQINVLNSK